MRFRPVLCQSKQTVIWPLASADIQPCKGLGMVMKDDLLHGNRLVCNGLRHA